MQNSKKKTVSKASYGIAKTFCTNVAEATKGGTSGDYATDKKLTAEEELALRQLEEEVMGEREEVQKSDVLERNLTQMVDILNFRLTSLDKIVQIRKQYCADDVNKDSRNMSKFAPKLPDDLDDNPKILRDSKTHSHKDSNLVSADKVYIDPLGLVLKTHQSTENGRKLETRLEESFGMVNLRELKGGKKTKASKRTANARKTEAQKFEVKKQIRHRLEKELQANMESFVTRSVLDPDIVFHAPGTIFPDSTLMESPVLDGSLSTTGLTENELPFEKCEKSGSEINGEGNDGSKVVEHVVDTAGPVSGTAGSTMSVPGKGLGPLKETSCTYDEDGILNWPISVQWKSHPHQKQISNLLNDNAPTQQVESEMDPELLLHYSLEKIVLPVWENMFRWLSKSMVIHRYVVGLFWFIKVRFFQKDSPYCAQDEAWLVEYLSAEYVKIIELISSRTHAEYEKDYAYNCLPYLFTNAVYFSFYYLCPGSRHLYTKGFRKTILMQIVQLMYGFQLCPVSVKAAWVKLFPDEIADDDAEEAETIPVLLATNNVQTSNKNSKTMKKSKSSTGIALTSQASSQSLVSSSSMPFSRSQSSNVLMPPQDGVVSPIARTRPKGGMLTNDNGGETEHKTQLGDDLTSQSLDGLSTNTSFGLDEKEENVSASINTFCKYLDTSPVAKLPPSIKGMGGFGASKHPIKLQPLRKSGGRFGTAINDLPLPEDPEEVLERNMLLRKAQLKKEEEMAERNARIDPLERVSLHAPAIRPRMCRVNRRGGGIRLKRQNRELLDARTLSPLVQDFLQVKDSLNGQVSQPLGRTVPIGWAVGGGADTHKHYPVNTQLHDDLSQKFSNEHHKIRAYSYKNHKGRMKSTALVARECGIILDSGSTAISRFSLDLVKRQKRGMQTAVANTTDVGAEEVLSAQAAFLLEQTLLQDDDLDNLDEYMNF